MGMEVEHAVHIGFEMRWYTNRYIDFHFFQFASKEARILDGGVI